MKSLVYRAQSKETKKTGKHRICTHQKGKYFLAKSRITHIILIVLSILNSPSSWSKAVSKNVPRSSKSGEGVCLRLESARNYVLTLVNKDRARFKLPALTLDKTANLAAQMHAEEMARSGYRSHWNRLGKKPLQRYNEAGGLDNVSENIASVSCTQLSKENLFSVRDLEGMEQAFMDQRPPNDLHRMQILRAEHNKIGIGIACAKPDGINTYLSLVQEFVDDYGNYSRIQKDITEVKSIEISGSLDPGLTLDRVSVYSEDAPSVKSVSELLSKAGSYSDGDLFVTEFYAQLEPGIFKTWIDGKRQFFTMRLIPDESWKPGLYSFSIWANSKKFLKPIAVSSQTALLREKP